MNITLAEKYAVSNIINIIFFDEPLELLHGPYTPEKYKRGLLLILASGYMKIALVDEYIDYIENPGVIYLLRPTLKTMWVRTINIPDIKIYIEKDICRFRGVTLTHKQFGIALPWLKNK